MYSRFQGWFIDLLSFQRLCLLSPIMTVHPIKRKHTLKNGLRLISWMAIFWASPLTDKLSCVASAYQAFLSPRTQRSSVVTTSITHVNHTQSDNVPQISMPHLHHSPRFTHLAPSICGWFDSFLRSSRVFQDLFFVVPSPYPGNCDALIAVYFTPRLGFSCYFWAQTILA